jgi:hypothetical protein
MYIHNSTRYKTLSHCFTNLMFDFILSFPWNLYGMRNDCTIDSDTNTAKHLRLGENYILFGYTDRESSGSQE